MLKLHVTPRKSDKPRKPHPDFPLFPHATGRWAKKVRGKLEYFGKTATDPKGEAALQLWLEHKDDLLAGRRPRIAADQVTVRDLLNRFRQCKADMLESGEIVANTYRDWVDVCDFLKDFFGLTRSVVNIHAEDFERLRAKLAKTLGPVTLGTEIQRVRCVFRYAHEAGLIDAAIRFGPGFKRPNRKVLRLARLKQGPRMFTPDEIQRILLEAGPTIHAMTLLGINCGFGNADCGRLPISAIDFKSGWIDFPRPKTGVGRRCPLWPETIKALEAAVADRIVAKDPAHADLVFLTKYGAPWHKDNTDAPISKEFTRLLRVLGIKRPGLSFYTLRHVFATVGGETKDAPAVSAIMGHDPGDMASIYRESISDERLKAVVAHVRTWLFHRGAKPRKPR